MREPKRAMYSYIVSYAVPGESEKRLYETVKHSHQLEAYTDMLGCLTKNLGREAGRSIVVDRIDLIGKTGKNPTRLLILTVLFF
jgi:hypothetical protein